MPSMVRRAGWLSHSSSAQLASSSDSVAGTACTLRCISMAASAQAISSKAITTVSSGVRALVSAFFSGLFFCGVFIAPVGARPGKYGGVQ
jgi:hypothetical protein